MEQPIIVIGMHRSGTSLISEMLQGLGVFMGNKKDQHEESRFFLELNSWIIAQVPARWDQPLPYKYYMNPELESFFVDIIQRKIKYLKFSKHYSFIDFRKKEFWGWKDPRNSFTINLWNAVFPNARIIHIYRNPIDVAISLNKREHDKFAEFTSGSSLRNRLKILLAKGRLTEVSFRCLKFDECIELWKEYLGHIFEVEKAMNKSFLHIKYEDLTEKPDTYIQEIIDFCRIWGRTPSANFHHQIKKDRRYNFLNNPSYINLAAELRNDSLVQKLGYYRNL